MGGGSRRASFLLCFVCIIPFISCDKETVFAIFNKSRDAVDALDVAKNMDVLSKHYFTTEEENSIWYHLVKGEREWFNIYLSFENLKFTEALIQKIAAHYKTCFEKRDLPKGHCLQGFASMLADLEKHLRWTPSGGDIIDKERVSFGILYNCAGVLSAHLALITYENIKDDLKKEPGLLKHKLKPFIDVLHIFYYFSLMGRDHWGQSVVLWREDQISPATICEMKEHFWKEFKQTCETRWYSADLRQEDESKKRTQVSYSPGNVSTTSEEAAKKRDDVDNLSDDYLSMEDSKLNIVDELGGIDNNIHKRYRAEITDMAKNEILYVKYMDADAESRGEAMDKLAVQALQKRSNIAKKMKEETKFMIKIDMYEPITKVMHYLKNNT